MTNNEVTMTAASLKRLYKGIELLEGFNSALVGVSLTGADGSIPVAVYDYMAVLNMLMTDAINSPTKGEGLSKRVKGIEGLMAKAEADGKVIPIFIQRLAIHPSAGDKSEPTEEISGPSYFENYGFDDDDEDDEDDDDDEEGYDEGPYQDKEDTVASTFMEITVEIGANNPDDCIITSKAEDIKKAVKLIFPGIPGVDVVSKVKFTFRRFKGSGDESEGFNEPGML